MRQRLCGDEKRTQVLILIMITRLKYLRANGLDPYRNQSIEKLLLDTCKKGEMILYLWANDKTVFIGKNQNAYTECNLNTLLSDGGFCARRFTGGGAVYHDKGNLNFTFIAHKEDYDIANQFKIMTDAMRSLGFDAVLNGRNDVLIEGKKFSGNAFYKSENVCLHHGTVLINSDPRTISKYLNVSVVKLNAKGVKSVASRVGNLSDYRADITADMIGNELLASFRKRYPHAEFIELTEDDLDAEALEKLREHFSDEKYILGDDVRYDLSFIYRYEWGVADVRLSLKGNIIEKVRIYSDTLDTEAVERKEKLLSGADITKPVDPEIRDIIEAFGEVNK